MQKTRTGLFVIFNIDLSIWYMVGKSNSDIEAGQNAGCKESVMIEVNKQGALLNAVKIFNKSFCFE